MAITEKYASSAGSGAKDGSSEANAWDWATMLTAAVAGDRINFKGSHTLTSDATFTGAGTNTSPIILRGYASAIGDGYLGRSPVNGPLVTTNFAVMPSSEYTLNMPQFSVLECFSISSGKNGYAVNSSKYGFTHWCSITTTSTSTSNTAIDVPNASTVIDCDISHIAASGTGCAVSSAGTLMGCRIQAGPGPGVKLGTAGVLLFNTIFGAGTYNISLVSEYSGACSIIGNTISGAASHGIYFKDGMLYPFIIANNLIIDNGGYGIYAFDADEGFFLTNNRFDRNTSGAIYGATDWASLEVGSETTSVTRANEFPGYASNDYRLGRLSPARQVGFPSYLDIGALQRVEDYPDAANVLTSDTTDGVTGTASSGGTGGSAWAY